MITWMGKGRRKRGGTFEVKNLFTELKFKVELGTHFQLLDLLFNFKSPSVLMALMKCEVTLRCPLFIPTTKVTADLAVNEHPDLLPDFIFIKPCFTKG